MRGMILAFQFLTRIPTPQLADFRQEEMTRCAVWFPLVGLVVGLLLWLATLPGGVSPWLGALLALLLWTGITGGLHLDGAADLADALGAAHCDPERFFAVMKDPHTGSFGVIVIVAILMTKLVALSVLLTTPSSALWPLLLIPAWARLGSVYWSQTLTAIAPGSGERFAWQVEPLVLWGWGILLFLVTWLTISLLFAITVLLLLWLWRAFLQWRLGGMSGDCLGAGIEYSECAMLLALLCLS